MIEFFSIPSFRIVWILLLGSFAGCSSDEGSMYEVEASAPEGSYSQRYDQPVDSIGFSPDEPFGHCMVFAGYNSDTNQVFFADPADNFATGHLDRAIFSGHGIQIINGYCTTVVSGKFATLTGAIVIKPPSRKENRFPPRWTQFGMPDFSQHAVGDWLCYCAPTSAASLIYFFSESFSEFLPQQIFSSDPDYKSEKNWTINRLIGGSNPPFPRVGSMAFRMRTSFDGGSSLIGMFGGMQSFINDHADNPKSWEVELITENETNPNGEILLEKLKRSCAAGDGILVTIIWGVPIPSGSDSSEEIEESSDSSTTDAISAQNAKDGNGDSDANESVPLENSGNSEGDAVNMPDGNARGLDELSPPSNDKVLDPGKRYPDASLEIKRTKEVLDLDTVIVDEFDLEERSDGVWYKKGFSKPFNGKARRFYPSGKILMEIPYSNGLKQGVQKIWKEDGELHRQVFWEKGKISRNR